MKDEQDKSWSLKKNGNISTGEMTPTNKKNRLFKQLSPNCVSSRSGYHWLVVGTVCIGAFMAAVNASIINVAMPTLSSTFSCGMNLVEWVAIAYLLTLTSLLTILGSLSDRIGRKFFYTLGFVVFVIGSALCGAAGNMTFLIVARVLQACGAAMLQANSIVIITSVAPANCRGKAIGFQGSAQAIGLSIGTAVGGMLIAHFGWRSIFYVNIPIGIVGTLAAAIILPRDRPGKRSDHFDYLGALLFTPALIMLVLILKNGYKVGWLSPVILTEAVAVVLLLGLFAWREKKCQSPMIDPKLLKSKAFVGGNITGMLSYALMFGVLFLMPFYLEWIPKLNTSDTGFVLTVVSLAMTIMAPFSGALADRISPRLLTGSGMALATFGAVVLITLSRVTPYYIDLLGLALVGLGMGIFTPPNNSSVMSSAPPEHLGVAGGILNMSRSMGMSIGVAIAGTLYSSFYSRFLLFNHAHVTTDRIQAFHISFWGMAVIGGVATLICIIKSTKGPSNHPFEQMPFES